MERACSWGLVQGEETAEVKSPYWRDELSFLRERKSKFLPYGLGRSYGDVCLNRKGSLISTRWLNRILNFNPQTGILHAESGITLEEIINFALPKGYFLPVTPGTKYVTLGGAIANDVHGKNHHIAGTFGHYIKKISLLRSDSESLLEVSQEKTPELFSATVAGLGLTGIIVDAEIKLKPVKSAYLEVEYLKFFNLAEFFEVSKGFSEKYEYTVAWIDTTARGKSFGRGIMMGGNHTEERAQEDKKCRKPYFSMPFYLPSFLLNRYSVSLFNFAYFNRIRQKQIKKIEHFDPFFYPLDIVGEWNKCYGKRGFFQFQCVVPPKYKVEGIKEILKEARDSGKVSFLSVIKEFGSKPSVGMLSFPREGVTLCLDFPNKGEETVKLLKKLEEVVKEMRGALYPAKDALMSPASFKQFYPRWQEFLKYIDPFFCSSFYYRIIKPLSLEVRAERSKSFIKEERERV
ncbi:MAG: FAD-binding oxidoreductase [Candidatus Dadabacteria bacterium]|nr:MAG: FAD-binding oxidoreductase [Candidatus Dadabacteria bacterium]